MIRIKLQLTILIASLFVSFPAWTQQGKSAVASLNDVETLMDNPTKYDNQKISIKGEVKDQIDSQSFVLESGGIFDDEVVVLMSPQMKEAKAKTPKEDSAVTVTGTVRMVPIVEIRRELSWDLDPQMEAELQGAKVFVVADKVAKK